MSEEKKMTDPELRSSLKDIRRQIEEAQAEGDSNEANRLFRAEQELIARERGNRPVVGGRDPSSPHGSRGA